MIVRRMKGRIGPRTTGFTDMGSGFWLKDTGGRFLSVLKRGRGFGFALLLRESVEK
jgi:hypothetical protein